jgi:hypothetical protein
MYYKKSGLIIGFHGCDIEVQKTVITTNTNVLKSSKNDYDWLGHGIYFWENNVKRALQFAKEVKKREPEKISEPAVLGAVLDLGNCLDLLDTENLDLLQEAYKELKEIFDTAEMRLPPNANDLLRRPLDCLVIEHLLKKHKDFDSVRGLFPEGKPLYAGSGFRTKDHIQICIRNTDCIKGYFLPRK